MEELCCMGTSGGREAGSSVQMLRERGVWGRIQTPCLLFLTPFNQLTLGSSESESLGSQESPFFKALFLERGGGRGRGRRRVNLKQTPRGVQSLTRAPSCDPKIAT